LYGNSLLPESPLHIVNCLKSFDFELFFVYTLVVEGPHLHINFAVASELIKYGIRVIRFYENNAKTKCETLKGASKAFLKEEDRRRTFASSNIHA